MTDNRLVPSLAIRLPTVPSATSKVAGPIRRYTPVNGLLLSTLECASLISRMKYIGNVRRFSRYADHACGASLEL